MKKSAAKKIKKNAISMSQKGISGQRSIISMFRQQSDKTMLTKEPSQPISKDPDVIHPEVVPSTSHDKNNKANKLSLKRRRINHSYEDLAYRNRAVEDSSSTSNSLFSTSCNGNCAEGDVNCINGEKTADACISADNSEVSLAALTHESNEVNYWEAKYEKQDKDDLNKNQHSDCLLNQALSTADNNSEFSAEISNSGSLVEGSDPVQGNKPSVQLDELLVKDEFDDVTGQLLDGEDQGTYDYSIPYYLENFLLIIDTVMDDEYYRSLFDDQDLFHISIFKSLSDCCQMLYVRLIQRRHRWLIAHKIQYSKIAPDLTPVLTDLVCAGFLLDVNGMTELEDVLVALPAPEVKVLAKSLKLNIASMQKEDLVSAILQHSRRGGITTFFGGRGASNSTSNMIMKRAKDLLGPCYKLDSDIRSVFMRIMILFGLHRTRGEDDDAFGGQQQVFQMLMSSLGRIKYPQYTVSRESKVFKDRTGFLRFISALQIESEMAEALESKSYEEAELLYKRATSDRKQLLEEKDNLEYDRSLPDYLRPYTAGAVHIRIMSLCVELLQYRRQYKEAVDLLQELIKQDVYHTEYRGRWYNRLALNLDHHLKQHSKALDTIKIALDDPSVRTGRRLLLYQRADKICHMAQNKKLLLQRWTEFEGDTYRSIKEAPKVYIQGKRLACGQQGPLYINKDGDDVTLLTRVEDVALAHYKAEGYTEGIHGEGSTFTFLFGLYFWDIIFMNGIPDTFYNPYQIYPLDWGSDQFYNRRQQAIDKRLAQIRSASNRKLEKLLENAWEEHEDTLCIGVNWDRFVDLNQAKGFVRCVGGSALSGILERLAKNMRYVGGGLPDLVVWNPEKKILKMVEVKGPGDRLSTKQILWLDYLIELGISAEVCHVQAISSKKLNS